MDWSWAVATYQWIIAHPWEALAIYLIATIAGIAIKRFFRAVAAVLADPTDVLRLDLAERALAAVRPWTLTRLLTIIRAVFTRTFGLARVITRAMRSVARPVRQVHRWPVGPTVAQLTAWISTFLRTLLDAADSSQAIVRSQIVGCIAQLRPSPGQRIVGATIFGVATLAFFYADAGLLTQTFSQMNPDAKFVIPDFLNNLPLQLSVASFVSFAMLGVVICDLIGITHVGPWSGLTGGRWGFLMTVTVLLFITLLFSSAATSFWRADLLQANANVAVTTTSGPTLEGKPIFDVATRALLKEWAVGLIQPLMLLIGVLVFVGALDFVTVAWLVLMLLVYGVLGLVRLVGQLLVSAVVPAIGWLLQGFARIAGVLGIAVGLLTLTVALIGLLVFTALATGVTAVVLFATFGLWGGLWALVRATIRLLIVLLQRLGSLLEKAIDVVLAPAVILWNWPARASWFQRRLGFRPIANDPPAPIVELAG